MLYIKLKESSFQISTPLEPTGLKTKQTKDTTNKQTLLLHIKQTVQLWSLYQHKNNSQPIWIDRKKTLSRR